MPKQIKVAGILACGKNALDTNGSHPMAVVACITDSFIAKLPKKIRGGAVIDGNSTMSAMSIGFDPRGSFPTPRRFCVWVDHKGDWHVEAYFGWNGSFKQALKLLRALEYASIDNIRAWGPMTPKSLYWNEDSISPFELGIRMIKSVQSEDNLPICLAEFDFMSLETVGSPKPSSAL